MINLIHSTYVALIFLCVLPSLEAAEPDTLPALQNSKAPANFQQMWKGFDPRSEPLEIEVLKEWEEDDVVLQVVRFRIGLFKGQVSKLAAIYGFPKSESGQPAKRPGLLQIHGGGQYADYKACLMNAKRGYATLSIAWAGRISAPGYLVNPNVVQLFWDGKTDDPAYRLTTDWAAVDGYHAPSRNQGNQFPSAKAAPWTLDAVESPRNSGWFLCALAARRALTFLEQQPEVDASRLGVYGHSMGGKLTIMTASDSRVKAAAPSCGGISDRDNSSELFRSTLGDDVSLKQVTCPVMFLSPANDFHGRINDLPAVVDEIQSKDWRLTCAAHHNHQDTAAYEVATLLWFDQHLKKTFHVPQTPTATLNLTSKNRIPTIAVIPDQAMPVLSVDAYYTQHGQVGNKPDDRENTTHRFWHHASLKKTTDGTWQAALPIRNTNKPLWAYANVTYKLPDSVSGAGYYYRTYTTNHFNLSSPLRMVTAEQLTAANVAATMKPTTQIESFDSDWEKEWFTYRPNDWAKTTHKLYDDVYHAPSPAKLSIEVFVQQPNQLVIVLDDYAAAVNLEANRWQRVTLSPHDFKNISGEQRITWNGIRRLKLCPLERQRAPRNSGLSSTTVGQQWKGTPPKFRHLQWEPLQAQAQ
ncbi:MAG: dienelactone hydrolase family protein [Fuerstiella sp.]